MNPVLLSVLSFSVAAIVTIYARRSVLDPESGAERFISDFGAPRSIFAVKYTGDTEAARQAFLRDQNLRNKYLIEQYVIAIAVTAGGILLLIWGFMTGQV